MGYRDGSLGVTHYVLDTRPYGFHPDPKLHQLEPWEWFAQLTRHLEFRITCICSSEG
jgi:hypothetical protein